MSTAAAPYVLTKQASAARWGLLPPRMRVLYVTTFHRTGSWLAEALAIDSASDMILEEAAGAAAGMARLRDDQFDAVLVSHDPPEPDALEFVPALRGGGSDEPILVLGVAPQQELDASAFEVGADAYLCVSTTTTRGLLWTAARAIQRHQLVRENRRLVQAERQRLQHEHQEADRMLGEQRALIADLEALAMGKAGTTTAAAASADEWSDVESTEGDAIESFRGSPDPPSLPENLVTHYADLLRTYVIMGSGNLSAEMLSLAELLAAAGVTPQQTMFLHLRVLEELIHGLGSRSARHVMTRADLLVLEVMVHLAEGYRQRLSEPNDPPRQWRYPGFEGGRRESDDRSRISLVGVRRSRNWPGRWLLI